MDSLAVLEMEQGRYDVALPLLQDSLATCTPTRTPLTVAVTQLRVKGQ